MKPYAKKTNWLLWFIALGAGIVAAYYVSALFVLPGVTLENINEKLAYAILHPWPPLKYWSEYSKGCMLGVLTVWVIALSYQLSKRKNFMTGRDFGSADWADIRKFNRQMAAWEDKAKHKLSENNRILSQHARMAYDTRITKLNNNWIVIGGPGTGKTAFLISPNIFRLHGSNIYTDPKGGLLLDFGKYLEQNGVVVKSVNLCDMRQSCQYNPFAYIRTQQDLQKLIANIIANTTPAESHSQDPFWEKSETLFLTAIFNYVWLECPRDEIVHHEGEYGAEQEKIRLEQNMRTVLYLLDEAEVPDKGKVSPLTLRMQELEKKHKLHDRHPAVRNYNRCMRGAGDTVRSIIISANARFAPFDNEELLRILDDDELDLGSIGMGVNGDKKTKTALFCIIPDEDTTFNFVMGMLYTQLFQELYRLSRLNGGRLPLDVGFWLDEFANTKMPDDFPRMLSTSRSRGIYMTVVLQSLSQIKNLYKDQWERIVSDCHTFIYLGGFEKSTHEYISSLLGKRTIDKRSNSVTYGSHGSSSKSEDSLGRELMTADEVIRMPNEDCIIQVSGQYPIYDQKYVFYETEAFKEAKALGDYIYEADVEEDETTGRLTTKHKESAFQNLDQNGLKYYKDAQKKGENVKVISMTEEELDQMDMKEKVDPLEIVQKALQDNMDQINGGNRKEQKGDNRTTEEMSLLEMLKVYDYDEEQRDEIWEGMSQKLPEDVIKGYAKVGNSAAKMRALREMAVREMPVGR